MNERNPILAACKRLALAIAPELSTQPLYVINSGECPEFQFSSRCYGWALCGGTFPEFLANRLVAQYKGPGNLIALDLSAIEADGLDPLNVCAHEVGHLVPVAPIVESSRRPLLQARHRRQWDAIKASSPPAPADDSEHDAAFVRRVLHCWTRATLAGWSVPLRGVIGRYGWSEAEILPLVLAEAVAMRNEPFAAIEAAPIPPSLLALHAECLAAVS